MIQLLMPMSGQGIRYQKGGYQQPKPMIPINGVSMLERVLESFPARWPSIFVIAENHHVTGLPQEIQRLRPNARIADVPVHSEGPLRAIEAALPLINDHDAVFVSYCDYGMNWDCHQFERFVQQSQCDMCIVSYIGFHAHYLNPQTYAYSRVSFERVVEMKEKGSFTSDRESEYASTGGYYFRTGALLKHAVKKHREMNLRANGELYTSLTVQAAMHDNPQLQVRVFEVPGFYQWGTPQDLQRFEYWENTFTAYNRTAGQSPGSTEQVLMPMAGLGSRFKDVSDLPKPFLPIGNLPMYHRALQSLPRGEKTVLVALQSCETLLKTIAPGTTIKYLAATPAGQALSTAEGLDHLDSDLPVFVSSCDHSLVLGADRWQKFSQAPDCDAAILTVQGFPGASDRPEAFAYVVPRDKSEFPAIERVSVKKALSATPHLDDLLVGSFWFRSAEVLRNAIDELKQKNIRVNGELYLDSIFELMIKRGLKVRMIPLNGYINWGDPDSLAEALYWYEKFVGRSLAPRERFPGMKQ